MFELSSLGAWYVALVLISWLLWPALSRARARPRDRQHLPWRMLWSLILGPLALFPIFIAMAVLLSASSAGTIT